MCKIEYILFSQMHIKPPPKVQSTNLTDYHVPSMDLPEFWKCAVDNQGRPYYYHVKIRIPQWEPPIRLLPLMNGGDETVVTVAKINETPPVKSGKSMTSSLGDGDDASTTETDDSSEDELNEKLLHLQQSVKAKKMDLGEFKLHPCAITNVQFTTEIFRTTL